MSNNNVILQATNLVKDYKISKDKYLRVLDGINLEILKGEVISIVGASGAGKSTLLHLLGTLDRPTDGEVYYEGENVFDLSSDKLARFRNTRIGFVFQFHHLLPEFTAVENTALASMISGRSYKSVFDNAKKLLEDVGLGERLDHKPSELSGGEAQRVAIARALINSPSVVFADEPTGNLDSKNSGEIMKLIFGLREKYNQTFVIVTHNEGFASLADRTLKMVDGKIVDNK
jgi:lipoprotein-releasing system ATP-binding protein